VSPCDEPNSCGGLNWSIPSTAALRLIQRRRADCAEA
jgi:hypothetical protein